MARRRLTIRIATTGPAERDRPCDQGLRGDRPREQRRRRPQQARRACGGRPPAPTAWTLDFRKDARCCSVCSDSMTAPIPVTASAACRSGTSPNAMPAKGYLCRPLRAAARQWRFAVASLARPRVPELSLRRSRPGAGGRRQGLSRPARPRPADVVRHVLREDANGKLADPDMSAAPFDPRAMMVVEFPSQHVAEEAFFEQRIERPAPPRYPASLLQDNPKLAKKFDKLRSLYLSQNPRAKPVPDSAKLDAKAKKRIGLRKDLLDAVKDAAKSRKEDWLPTSSLLTSFGPSLKRSTRTSQRAAVIRRRRISRSRGAPRGGDRRRRRSSPRKPSSSTACRTIRSASRSATPRYCTRRS